MNDKQKKYMKEQQEKLVADLESVFELPVFEDEIADDELPATGNYFLVVYGDMRATESVKRLSQEVYVVYISEDNGDVEASTLDILTVVSKIKGYTFYRTIKERMQKAETDDFVDKVTIIFRRKLSYECQV
ncbi:hypothetical protein [Virgibacillus salexigens]|uniref:DUF3168 domain-containing protein n=1 Tax=Virgibacillus kapii TaxID=1638645 RepID=A0ABQ2DA49_9BACI|nr:hypothetical protein [Virgibacillus kapii]GGJ50980.1 hypothetical protein GCM10007111_11560 [Virgibacillus kapii]